MLKTVRRTKVTQVSGLAFGLADGSSLPSHPSWEDLSLGGEQTHFITQRKNLEQYRPQG